MSDFRALVDPKEELSIRDQCDLLGVARSSVYYECQPETAENLAIMRRLDELNLKHPVYGSRRLLRLLENEGVAVNRKRGGGGSLGSNIDSRHLDLSDPRTLLLPRWW